MHRATQVPDTQGDPARPPTFVHDKQPASKDLLIKGTRVMVEVERQGPVDHALRVEIFAGGKRTVP